jgi:hypothetical protein
MDPEDEPGLDPEDEPELDPEDEPDFDPEDEPEEDPECDPELEPLDVPASSVYTPPEQAPKARRPTITGTPPSPRTAMGNLPESCAPAFRTEAATFIATR